MTAQRPRKTTSKWSTLEPGSRSSSWAPVSESGNCFLWGRMCVALYLPYRRCARARVCVKQENVALTNRLAHPQILRQYDERMTLAERRIDLVRYAGYPIEMSARLSTLAHLSEIHLGACVILKKFETYTTTSCFPPLSDKSI